jgi:AcrR family transcriptional regulator
MKTRPPSTRRSERRGSAQPLTRERIVEAALELIDADGLAGFSTRKLGERLGVEAMSIYHHFPSKQHLLDALVDHAVSTIAEHPGLDPERRLRRLCYDYRAMAHRFPRLYPLIALHRLNTPMGVRFIDRVLGIVRALAPNDEIAAGQFRAVGYYLTGAALEETSGYAKGPSAAEPVSDAYIAQHCPHLAAAAPYFKQPHWDKTFELGLATLMAGFDAASRVPEEARKR